MEQDRGGYEAAYFALYKKLYEVVIAIECAMRRGEIEEWTESLWDAYDVGRQALFLPTVTYPGGYDDAHIHYLEEDDECDICEERKALSLEEEEETR